MKKFVAILMVLVLSLSLAACGNDSPAETNEAGKSNASTENAVASDEPIELTFPCIWVGADSKAEQWAQIVSDFNAEYEGQIVIKIDEQTDYTLYEEKSGLWFLPAKHRTYSRSAAMLMPWITRKQV